MTYKAKGIMALAVLTFIIPVMQWLTGELMEDSSYKGFISSILAVLCACLWYGRIQSFSFLPPSPFWKALCYLGVITIFILLIIDIRNEPVSKITGQARSPLETIDVIISLPIAEELVFRGVIWSVFKKLSGNSSGNVVAILVGSSLLFGVEHLGYWAQSNWPLPIDAFVHALSMMAAGICFGIFRQVSQSLTVPMVVHMLANGIILLTQ